jgi:hypothetical protein
LREVAPPYAGEGPHALWHVSEDDSIERFEPHHRPGHALDEPLVWAVDTRHLPLYWFPRDCPRVAFWARQGHGDRLEPFANRARPDERREPVPVSISTDGDVERFLGGDRTRRVHVVEPEWLESMRTTRVVAYRLPAATFEPWDRFWISHEAVEPLDLVELGDLVARHRTAEIELRVDDALLVLWEAVVGSTLDYSGIRLRNAVRP